LFNHDPKGKISKQLYKLKKYSLTENKGNSKNIEKLAKYVAGIHSHNINKNVFKVYDAEWVRKQVYKIKENKIKNDLISALKIMSQIKVHNAQLKDFKFLTWDIIQSTWQTDYKSGKIGSCVWDMP